MKNRILTVILLLFTIICSSQSLTLVKDICPHNGYNDYNHIININILNNKLIFFADDGTHGKELWEYDGYNDPVLVEDIYIGETSCGVNIYSSDCLHNDKYYFVATRASKGEEIWIYDGNDIQVLDINPGSESSNPWGLRFHDNILYFHADTDTYSGWWSYNESTSQLNQVDEYPRTTAIYYDGIYYDVQYNNTTEKNQIISSEDPFFNNYTVEVDNISDIITSTSIHVIFNNKIVAMSCPYPYPEYYHAWIFDPAASTANLLDDNLTYYSTDLCIYNNNLYFSVEDIDYGSELWKYDGTNPPSMVANISETGSSEPHNFTVAHNRLYFEVDGLQPRGNLYCYDGINPPYDALDFDICDYPSNLTMLNNNIYLTVDYYNYPTPPKGFELYLFEDGFGSIDNDILSNIDIYPNPTDNNFNIMLPEIESSSYQLSIINELGILVIRKEITESIEINIQNWASGLYIIELKDNQNHKSYTKKLQVQ